GKWTRATTKPSGTQSGASSASAATDTQSESQMMPHSSRSPLKSRAKACRVGSRRSMRLFRRREKKLRAADLVLGDRALAFVRGQPVDELHRASMVDLRIPRRIDRHHAVGIVEARVAFDHDLQIGLLQVGEISAAVSEGIAALFI